MKRNAGASGLLLAAALLLTGCGGQSSTSSPESLPERASGTPAPSATAEAKTYTNDDLAAVITSLKDSQGNRFTLMPATQLEQNVEQARQLITGSAVSPDTCGVFASAEPPVPEGSTYAAGTSAATQTTLTIVAVPDSAVMADELAAARAAVGQCSSFQVQNDGQTTTSSVHSLDANTHGQQSFGTLTTRTLPNGQTQTVMSVSGTEGDLTATAVRTGSAVASGTQDELVLLVNEALLKG